ncbi:MAG TPA: ATP-binding protein [Anaerolineaceae bacterium]|nr:ATP-binding protein [Anaerolineaceae bacterium]
MIRRSLVWKLSLAFLLVAVTATALLAITIRLTSSDRLSQLIIDQQLSGVEQILSNYYTTNGSWKGIESQWGDLEIPNSGATNNMMPMGRNMHGNFADRRNLFGLADAEGVVLIPIDSDNPRGTHLAPNTLAEGSPLVINGQRVGTILITKQFPGLNTEESLFLDRTNQAIVLASLGALLVALIIGIFLSRSLTQPLKALTHAAQKIADGQLKQEVTVNSKDEIGQLAVTFNRMSQEVARANQQRRQMTADIAHDLRTPLTVIGGYVEAMRDDILQPTPERLDLIYSEIERLQAMVGDLRMLSQADAGELALHPQTIAPQSLLQRAAELFQHQAEQRGITLVVEVDDQVSLPNIPVDEARMMQVLDNLISNAFRYTPAGGKINLSARLYGSKVRLAVQDTGSGIPAEELSAIFERFYRADPSRHSERTLWDSESAQSGSQSGLGLAIVKALVEAQGGQIWAESQLGHGTTMIIEFPAQQSHPGRQ